MKAGLKRRYHLVLDEELYAEVRALGEWTFASEVRRALALWVWVRRGEVEVRRVKDGVVVEVV